jgi:hypothetical protein
VSDPKLDRFRRLERPRAAGEAPAPARTATDARIEAVEGPGAPAPDGAAGPGSGGDLERFRAPLPRGSGLELDLSGDDVPPFRRCAACQTDNFRAAPACSSCGADLDTEPQRRFNQRVWAARQAEAAAEAERGAAREAQLAQDRVEEAALRRQAAEAMARQVGESERERLGREGFGDAWGGPPGLGGPSSTPWAWRWLRAMPAGRAVAVGLLLVVAPVLLYLVLPGLGLVAGVITLVLFTPPSWRTRVRSRPWW